MGKFQFTLRGGLKTIIILVLLYVLLGVFLTGGVGYEDGRLVNDIKFEFGTSFDAMTLFTILIMAAVGWLVINYVLDIGNISNRKQFFKLIAVGLLIFLGYMMYLGPEMIIPAFKDGFLANTGQMIINPFTGGG